MRNFSNAEPLRISDATLQKMHFSSKNIGVPTSSKQWYHCIPRSRLSLDQPFYNFKDLYRGPTFDRENRFGTFEKPIVPSNSPTIKTHWSHFYSLIQDFLTQMFFTLAQSTDQTRNFSIKRLILYAELYMKNLQNIDASI